jgi:tape measure domain-containing protein
MSNKVVNVGLRIEGDATSAREALTGTAKDLVDLAADASKVQLLENAVASVERFDAAVRATQQQVRTLRETLSEAYDAGADAALTKKLEKELAALERQSDRAEKSLERAKVTVVDLNLRFAEAGISTSNLAEKKAELETRSAAVSKALQDEAEYQRYLANETDRAAKAAAQLAADTNFEAVRQAALEYQKAADYAAWWADSLDQVEQAQTDLAAAQDLDKQRQANLETQKATEYTNWWAKALDDADRAAKTAQASTDRLQNAFETLGMGVTSDAAKIEKEILDINQALLALARSTDVTGDQFDVAFAKGKARISELEQKLRSADSATDAMRGKVSLLSGAMGQLAAMFGGMELARQFITANVEIENLERTFKALTGDANAAGREMEYVTRVANDLGLNVVSAAKAYAELSASTKGTSVEGKVTREVFEAVAASMANAGKSAADTQGALLALSQMASKGVVSMEELRGQLAERLPGALKAAADGLGITVEELVSLVETGRLTAREFFPALTKGLNDLSGDAAKGAEQAATLSQTWSRFTNVMTEFFSSIGKQGGIAAMKVALDTLGATVIIVTNVFLTLGKTIGTFFGALASGDIGIRGFSDKAKAAFAEIEAEARSNLVNAAKHNSVLAASLDDTGKKALAAAIANDKVEVATTKAGIAASTAEGGWTSLNNAYAGLEKLTKDAIDTAVKNVEAKKAEGSAAIALAQAFGTETEQRRAQAAAAEANAQAQAELAERKKEYYAIVEGNINSLKAELAAQGDATDAQKKARAEQEKVIEGLEKTAAVRRVEADAAIAQAEASKLAASQAKANAEAAADNSLRLGELRAAYEAATEAVKKLREAKSAGKPVTDQLAEAERKAGAAALLYRDAISDQIQKITALNNAKQAGLTAEQAIIRVQIERLKAGAEVARAMGDEVTAGRKLNEVKELEIKLAQLVAKAKQAEAEASKLVAQAKIEDIRKNGEMTAAKEAEIKALEAAVRVKEAEAQIAGITAQKLNDLARATGGAGNAAGGSIGNHNALTRALQGQASAANSAAAAQERLAGLKQSIDGHTYNEKNQMVDPKSGEVLIDANGNPITDTTSFLDKGSREPVPVDAMQSMYRQGATVEEAEAGSKHFNELLKRAIASKGNSSMDAREMDLMYDRVAREAVQLGKLEQKGATVDLGTSYDSNLARERAQMRPSLTDAGGTSEMQNAAGRAGNATTVNVTFNGKKTSMQMGSRNDANALTNLLRTIELDGQRANL